MIRLLHVDDDPAILDLGKHFLEHSGDLVIDTATSCETARTMLGNHTYDAIVSDYHMPDCTGIELLRFVRHHDGRTPFLFFSDQGNEEAVIAALTSGADFFLPKGILIRSQFIQLEHAIRESVMRRRAEQECEKISSVLRIREAAVRSSLCPLALCDTEGRIQYANPASLKVWGYHDETEVVGKYASEFVVSPEIPPSAIPDLLRQKTWMGQATARRKDGTTFDARVYVNTMADESGAPLGFVASFTDLSRQERARGQLESYIRDIRFVSEKANELADLGLDTDVSGFIADVLYDLVPQKSLVIFSSVYADSVVRVEAARSTDAILTEVEQVIGRPITGLTLQSTSQGLSSMLPRTFIEIDGGIEAITFGQLSPELCRKLREFPLSGRIIGSGFSWGGRSMVSRSSSFPQDFFPRISTCSTFSSGTVRQSSTGGRLRDCSGVSLISRTHRRPVAVPPS